MKNKCKFLIKQSLNKKINTKSFKIVNVLLCILLIGLSNMDRIVAFFGGDFANEVTIKVKDEVGIEESFKTLFRFSVGGVFTYAGLVFIFQGIYHYFKPIPLLYQMIEEQEKTK